MMKKRMLFCLLLIISLFVVTGCEEEDTGRNLTADEKKALMEKVDDLKYLDFYGKSFKTSELTNQEVLHLAFYMSSDDANFKDLKKFVDENVDYNLKPENYRCFIHEDKEDISSYYLLYNEETGEYDDNLEHAGHGGGNFQTDVYNRYRNAYNRGDIFTISVYKLFSSTYPDTGGVDPLFYTTYNDAKDKKNAILDLNEYYDWENLQLMANPQDYLNDMDSSRLVTYIYTFKLVDNNYILTEYEIKK